MMSLEEFTALPQAEFNVYWASHAIAIMLENPPDENHSWSIRDLQPFVELGLCGGCHQWASNPYMTDHPTCNACDRTEDQIREFHGICWLQELLEPDIEL